MSIADSSYVRTYENSTKRTPPRSPEYMQSDYLEKFDARTFVSDAHVVDGGIEICCPPPLNLELDFRDTRVIWRGRDVGGLNDLQLLDRAAYAVIDTEIPAGESVELSGALGSYSVLLQPDGCDRFTGRNVLVTHQRDNDLAWIAYWVLHHVELYGMDSVLLYDNGSTRYSTEDLERLILLIPGVKEVVVVKWPTPFGPLGFRGNWDSDFGQHIYLRNSYSRFLKRANCALVCDVDELFVSRDVGTTIPGLFFANDAPMIGFKRRQVVQVLMPGRDERELRAHDVYGLVEEGSSYLPNKYAYSPVRLSEHPKHVLKIHYPTGVPRKDVDPDLAHIRHFGGIRITWRSDWSRTISNVETWPRGCWVDSEFLRDVRRLRVSWSELKGIADTL